MFTTKQPLTNVDEKCGRHIHKHFNFLQATIQLENITEIDLVSFGKLFFCLHKTRNYLKHTINNITNTSLI